MLQGNKYVIQGVLNRTDFGITYQAIHTYLNQTVVLQTLAGALRQRSDFAQLRQQFVTGVRSLSSRPAFPRVLDCFEEDGLPIVVLEWATDRVVPKLSDWLSLPAEAVPASDPVPVAPVAAAATSAAAAPAASEAPTAPAETPVSPAATALPAADPAPVPTAHPPTVVVAQQPVARPVRSSSKASKAKRGLPAAIAITGLIGICVGAGMGAALRFEPLTHRSASGAAGGVRSSLFSREETFPPQQDWPISENPTEYPSTTTAEEPVYRVNSAPSYWAPPADYSAPKSYSPPPIPAAPAEKASPTPRVETKSTVVTPSYAQPAQSAIDTPPVRSAPVAPSAVAPVAPAADLPEPINVAPPVRDVPSPLAPKRLNTVNPAIVNQ